MVRLPSSAYEQAGYSYGKMVGLNKLPLLTSEVRDLHDYRDGKTEKINQRINDIFPRLETKPVLKKNGLFGIESVLRLFFRGKSWQNLPFSAKTRQKVAEKAGFLTTDLLKGVKSMADVKV